MDYKYIEQLLDRYFEAETTIEEEAILRSFFRQKDVPVRLLPYRDLFEAEDEMAGETLGDDFDKKVLAKIGQSEKPQGGRRLTIGYRLAPLYKAAACLGLLLTFTMALQQAAEQSEPATEAVSTIPAAEQGEETALGDKNLIPDSAATAESATTTEEKAKN